MFIIWISDDGMVTREDGSEKYVPLFIPFSERFLPK